MHLDGLGKPTSSNLSYERIFTYQGVPESLRRRHRSIAGSRRPFTFAWADFVV
jgi:hypothetical protein